ncbi:Cyclin-A3-1 [Euphorbia peplus]|nr:Cyclin-A3-1 [Euphorbia peplus]
MHIASKYEDISPPNVEDFCYVTDNTYNKEEAVCMEKEVLTKAAQENCKSRNLQFEFTIQAEEHPWNASLQCCSGYRPSDLKECVLAIHDLHLNKKGSSLKTIRDKYSLHKDF